MIRISVLGAASIAVRSILPLLTPENGFALVGIGYREASQTKTETVARQFDSKAIPLDSILDDVDAIYIPYPPALHKEWILKAIERGVHVWCEKPLCTNSTDVEEIENLALSKNVVVLENYMFLRHKQHQLVHQLLPKIGRIQIFRAAFAFPPFPDSNNIRYNRTLGGGALLDCSGYPIQASIHFLGTELSVESASLIEQPSSDDSRVDIAGDVTLRSKAGVPAHIYFGFNHEYQCMYEIIGSDGILKVSKAYTPRPSHETQINMIQGGTRTIHRVPAEDHFLTTAREFHSRIINKQPLSNYWDATKSCIRLQEDIRRCALKIQST